MGDTEQNKICLRATHTPTKGSKGSGAPKQHVFLMFTIYSHTDKRVKRYRGQTWLGAFAGFAGMRFGLKREN